MTVSTVRPWRTALQRERSLPSSVVGPVLLRALRRLASICLRELMGYSTHKIGFVLLVASKLQSSFGALFSKSPQAKFKLLRTRPGLARSPALQLALNFHSWLWPNW